MNSRKNIIAFTMVEMALVIMIIGILVGAVMAAQNLFEASQNHKLISSAQNYVAAYNSFKLKYTAKPGDMENASSYFSGTTNGNGDGKIYSTAGTSDMQETSAAWNHLYQAGFVQHNYTGELVGSTLPCDANEDVCPRTYYRKVAFWFQNDYRKIYSFDGTGSATSPGDVTVLDMYSSTGNWDSFELPVEAARIIDTKMDDGAPATGRLFAINPTGRTTGCVSTDFASSTTATWLGTGTECGLIYWFNEN